jgi:uncharacterized membrane protein YidH (DUF202 family)
MTPTPPGCCCSSRQRPDRYPAEVDAVACSSRVNGNKNGGGRGAAFCLPPLLGQLLFDNENSEARDHCANERTFLSYVKLSIYLTFVSVAIVMSFHLKQQPTKLELRMAVPLGAIFWVLALACLGVGLANYMNTINKYGRKAAIVQTGWKTQIMMGTIATCIVGASITLVVVNKIEQQPSSLL